MKIKKAIIFLKTKQFKENRKEFKKKAFIYLYLIDLFYFIHNFIYYY